MQYQYKIRPPTVVTIVAWAPSDLDTFKETAEAINSLSASAGSWVASATTFDDSIANLWVSNVKEAIEELDIKTDQIDVVWSTDYNAYVNWKI